jgi:hypothetical protein
MPIFGASVGIDFLLRKHGSTVLLQPISGAGKGWLDLNVTHDSWRIWGGAVAPCFVEDLLAGIAASGLTVAGITDTIHCLAAHDRSR